MDRPYLRIVPTECLGPTNEAIKEIPMGSAPIVILTANTDRKESTHRVEGRSFTKVFVHINCNRFFENADYSEWTVPVPLTEQYLEMQYIYIEQLRYDAYGTEWRVLHRGYFRPQERPFGYRGEYVFRQCGLWRETHGMSDLRVKFSLVAPGVWERFALGNVKWFGGRVWDGASLLGATGVQYPSQSQSQQQQQQQEGGSQQLHCNCICPVSNSHSEILVTDNVINSGNLYLAFKDNGHLEYSQQRPARGIQIETEVLKWVAALATLIKVQCGSNSSRIATTSGNGGSFPSLDCNGGGNRNSSDEQFQGLPFVTVFGATKSVGVRIPSTTDWGANVVQQLARWKVNL